MSSQGKESESGCSAQEPNVGNFQENSGPHSSSGKLKVTFLASEWRSSKGGLSTLSRELAINVAKSPEVEVTFFVPRCNDDDKKAAHGHKINLVKAKMLLGMDELSWLNFPPNDLQIDIVVGHGVKLGHQAQVIRNSHKCKWVQVVHTAPEELGMYKTYSNPISVNEKKHETEVALCEIADFVVTVGPKLNEAFRAYLRGCKKDQIFEFTPGILAEFSDVQQDLDDREIFRVLVFGRGDDEDFLLKGFDIAANAVATLSDCHLLFVGAPDGKLQEIKNRFLEYGILANNLTVRSFLHSREGLKKVLCEADLAVMPSRTEGFGLTGLEALSAGLPVLVSRNSGFGEAIKKLPFGSLFLIDSEDPTVWAKAIEDVRNKERRDRLQESKILRTLYEKKYGWERQSNHLVGKMISMINDGSQACERPERIAVLTQQTQIKTEHDPGTLPIKIKIDSVTFQKAKSRDPVQQEEAKRLIMKEMTNYFIKTHADRVPVENYSLSLHHYLNGVLDVIVREAIEGSLLITVECRTLEILERLWEDYCCGHLNAEAEERLLTDEIKKRFDVESVKLETTILEKDYLACKLHLMDISKFLEVNQDSSLQEDESLPQDHTDQAADETQTQTAEEGEPVTVHFAVNYMGNVTNTETEAEESLQQLSNEDSSDVPVDEPPQYFQHLKLIQDATLTEGNENSLRLAVKCNNLEGFERLWEDYRSGRLNEIAEKYLVTDEIKRRFHVDSVNLATTILEEDYLACKEFLSSKPDSNARLAIKASGETSTPTSAETQTQIAVKRETLEEIQIEPAEESQSQMADGSEIFVSGNTRIPSANETRTFTVEGTETQVTAETQVLSAEETSTRTVEATETGATGVSKILSLEKTQIQTTSESTSLTKDEIQVQPPEETYTRTKNTEFRHTLDTEDADIEFPETYEAENTEKGGPSLLNAAKFPGSTMNIHAPHSSYKAFKIDTTFTRLDLSGKMIGGHGVFSLSEGLKVNNTLTDLNVSDNNIGVNGAVHLFGALNVNGTLTSLNVSGNKIGVIGARHLSEALNVNGTLTGLNVSGNNIGVIGARNLSEALNVNGTLTGLNVSSNNIGVIGAGHIFGALNVNETLTSLNVSGNKIGDNGACHLSEALNVNRTLTDLDVSGNNIGFIGAGHLFGALNVNGTLANLNVSDNGISYSGAGHLSKALKVNGALTNLNVSCNNIGVVGAGLLSEPLKVNRTLTNLNVSWNNIGEIGTGHLSEALKVNGTLVNLNVSGNNIGESGVCHLSEALKVNGTLTTLDVSANNIGEIGTGHLSEALKVNGTLVNLDVSGNNIGESGVCHLSEALKVNGTLTTLDVSANNIGDKGAGHLSIALGVNRTLTYLNVSCNNVGDNGAARLYKSLKVNRGLTNLNMSRNNIGENGFGRLSKALIRNVTLVNLDVSGNNIGESCAAHISEALQANRAFAGLGKGKDNIGDSGAGHLIGLTPQRDVGSFFAKELFQKKEERSTLEIPEWTKREHPDIFASKVEKETSGVRMAAKAAMEWRKRFHASLASGGLETSGVRMAVPTAVEKKRLHASHASHASGGLETTTVSKQRKLESLAKKKEEVSEHAK